MLISACEDTGLADPYAISVVTSCADAFDRVGLPEGRYHLAHAALYLATAPKSNSSMAFFDALSSVEKEDADVPNHLKDGNRDAEGFGHGDGYLYPHAYRDHWVAQQYLPTELVGRVFYTPSNQGYEAKIRDDVLSRREIQIARILETAVNGNETEAQKAWEDTQVTGSQNFMGKSPKKDASEFAASPISEWWVNAHFKGTGKHQHTEQLTFTPKDERKESALDKADKSWRSRLDSNRAEILLSVRKTMTTLANLARHHRSLIWNADDGLLLWEIARKTPEGVTCGLCRNEKGLAILEQYGRTLGDLDKPMLLCRPQTAEQFLTPQVFTEVLNQFQYKGTIFDRLFFRDPFVSNESIDALAQAFKDAALFQRRAKGLAFTDESIDEDEETNADSPLAPRWKAIISQRIPAHGQRISDLVRNQVLTAASRQPFESALATMSAAEQEFFGDKDNALFNWDMQTIEDAFKKQGLTVTAAAQILEEKRRITPQEIARWFDTETSAYGAKMAQAVGGETLEQLRTLLATAANKTLFNWQTEIAFVTVEAETDKN